MKFIFATLLSVLILSVGFSCTKTTTSPSSIITTTPPGGGGTPKTAGKGGINGTVSPVSVLCQMDAIDVHTGLVVATTTSSSKDGSFSFSNLNPSQYNIRATPTPDPNNYGIHTWIGVVVSAGAVANVGPISFQ